MGAAAWRGFQSILCPVDFSGHARRSLRQPVALAARVCGALPFLHVDDPLLVSAAAVVLNDRVLVSRSARELRRFVRSTIPAGAVTRVAVGTASDEILNA